MLVDLSARLSTITAGVNNFTLDSAITHNTSLSLACQRTGKAQKTYPRGAHAQQPDYITTPTGNLPEAPELETPCYEGQNVSSQWCPL